jgi:hypothetical protein
MDFARVDWSMVALAVAGACVLVFGACAWRRQWSVAALLVGLAHLPIAFVNAAAPFRGALDPGYAGYSLGLVRAAPGAEVAIFSGAVLLGALASACIVVLNRPGPRNHFVLAFDAFLLLLLVPGAVATLQALRIDSIRIEFGEYLQLSGLPAFLFQAGLLLAPPLVGAAWAWRRSRATA